MKKTLLAAAIVAMSTMGLQAQTVEMINLPKDMAAAEAAGYGQMWGTWEWGALMPANTLLYSDDNVKLTLMSDTYMNYTPAKAGKDIYGPYLYLSSTVDNFVSDPVYDPAAIANTSSGKQGGALKLEPTVDGRVTLAYSSGFNNRSVFVWDMTSTLNEGMGALILANNVEQGAEKGDQMKADGVVDKVHRPTFDVVAGHTYYVFGSNAQQELYSMTFTSFMNDGYVAPVASADGVDAMLLDLPKDMAAAEAAGYGQMWGTWEWGLWCLPRQCFSLTVRLSSHSNQILI